jgi:hypothetical protein
VFAVDHLDRCFLAKGEVAEGESPPTGVRIDGQAGLSMSLMYLMLDFAVKPENLDVII